MDEAAAHRALQWSVLRFGEHHPHVVSTVPACVRADLDEAVRAIELPNPSALDISTQRMRNQARRPKP